MLIRLILVCIVAGFLPMRLSAQSPIGITATGKVVPGSPRKSPWASDVIRTVSPEYPIEDRRTYHQGTGLFRITFDLKTGWATNVAVRKSTGWKTLDEAVITALRQWRVRPGKWKQFDIPATFGMSRNREEAMEKIRRLEAQDGR